MEKDKNDKELFMQEEKKKEEKDKQKETKTEKKYIPGIGIDVGTANVCSCRRKEDGTFDVKSHRNMLFEMELNEFSDDLLERGDYVYIKSGKKCYIVGADALSLVNAIGKGTIIRPMANGLLNVELKTSQELLNKILEAVVGKPICENEPLRFSVPASNVVNKPGVNNLFHQMVLKEFFNSLGFISQPINEALANLYNESPSMKLDNGEEYPLTGYSISFGGGMVNSAIVLKGMSLIEFCSTSAGDQIDQNVSLATGEPTSKIIVVKEKKLNLDKIDQNDRIQVGLGIYYSEMISRIFKQISKEFSKDSREFEGAVDVVICGGTAMAPGFINRVKEVVKNIELPFRVGEIRLSSNPFFSVSQGCCLRGLSDYSKMNKK